MLYSFELTIPANTTKDNATEADCIVPVGVVKRVFVGFPPGPEALAHVVILYHEHQVWPTNPDADFAWDNFIYEFDEEFRIDTAPYLFKIKGWNDDDAFPHTVTLMLNILTGEYGIDDLRRLQRPVVVG